ncbi:MAG: ferrous iron transport protein B [Lachnospiraceae bacterium]|nr:ferrous iron transport protein B [Lachnospiraceae bacterium]
MTRSSYSDTVKTIALTGNPNVGKSTVFNSLTGLNQHTGNWPGKTVITAQGYCSTDKQSYRIIDLPGTYSLLAHSAEEEVARNYICFGDADVIVVVCDATCLERNLNLVLQVLEITSQVIICVNLLDEAKRKGIRLDLALLSKRLGVPVVGTVARKKKSLVTLLKFLDEITATPSAFSSSDNNPAKYTVSTIQYPQPIEDAIAIIAPFVQNLLRDFHNKNSIPINCRWLSLQLLDPDPSLTTEINNYFGNSFLQHEELQTALFLAHKQLSEQGIDRNCFKDMIVSALVKKAELICTDAVIYDNHPYSNFDRGLDRLLTSKLTGYPVMLLLLTGIFWLTITGANIPSGLLASGLFQIQDYLTAFFQYIHAPAWLHGLLVLGGYRVLAWVVSVMLPPMAIFFPLFTLLEDMGYLPRIAYNLDQPFKRCGACGKQALCMCMGFGCNAAGVIGCRIIDSPRERLLAILTNNFVPCNGRFPTLIAILTMFFVGTAGGFLSSIRFALLLTLVIIIGVATTFAVTRLLSRSLLRGIPSSFILELPSYRRPQFGKVILRSIFDRTIFVLGRAMIVAIPAGLLIWIMANVTIENVSILNRFAALLDPFARLMGLDGVILIAFILGFPANKIVIPIVIMTYMAQGSIMELDSLTQIKELFVSNGWTWATAVSTMLFCLFHWPCSTTLLTIKKETGSLKWTALAAGIPTLFGIFVCILFTTLVKDLGYLML